jgi:putative intracellular protease/amidase
VDPRSLPDKALENAWEEAMAALEDAVAVSTVDASQYHAVFVPGGHGTMYDLPDNPELARLLSRMAADDKVIAAMCHGPSILVGVTGSDGKPLVAGRRLTSFTDEEEGTAGFAHKMPFLLESRLRELGADFVEKPNWSDHVEVDGNLVTGQNPQSSKSTAQAVIELLSN